MGSKPVTPDSLNGLMLVSNPAVDPNGRVVLYTATRIDVGKDRYETHILTVDPKTLEKRILQEGPNDICPLPSPDGHGYVFLRRVEGRKPVEPGIELRYSTLTSPASRKLAETYGVVSMAWAPDSRHIAVAMVTGKPDEDVKIVESLPVWFNGRGYVYWAQVKPFIVDVESGAVEELDLGFKWVQVTSLDWSPDGRRLAIVVSTEPKKPYLRTLIVYDLREDMRYVIAENLSGYGEVAWSPDSSSIAYLGHRRERGFSTHNRVIVFNVETGEEKCLTCKLDRNALNNVNSDVRGPSCVKRLVWSRAYGIVFHLVLGGRVALYSVNPDGEPAPILAPHEAVVDEFAVAVNSELVAVTLMDPITPKELYLIRNGRLIRASSHTSGWLRRYQLSRPRRFTFTASDGVEIEGWVLQPPEGVELKGWVLYIHGGPKTAWGYGFMHEFHVLSGSGYAVMYVNPRGSDGYSEDFADIRCRYGERDYQDLMEAAHYAVEKLGMPRQKAAVMGGSYGGFMTNWIIGHTSFFAAAITMRSISNWVSMYGTTDIGWYFVEDQICCTPWKNPELCWDKSPLKYVENVRTPTLIVHSDQDYRCWLDQALQLYTALKLNGVRVRLAIFPGENHDLSRTGKPKHRVERLKLIVAWLNENIGRS